MTAFHWALGGWTARSRATPKLQLLLSVEPAFMEFRIADTFTDSLARLTGEEQKAVKTTAFDLQLNPASPGMSFHKLDKAKDKNFWSVRVNKDIRLIVHRTAASLLLCYVDHHDRAYAWAERRKVETHPTTGAAQLVELRETVKEIVVPNYVQTQPLTEKPAQVALFANKSDDELLSYGVPAEWLSDVKSASEEGLLNLASHLPAEAAEALLELATGGTPRRLVRIEQMSAAADAAHRAPPLAEQFPRFPAVPTPAAFAHPDAQRRFRNITSSEELQRALDYPWDRWTIFLHPDQREMVEYNYAGPARVSGSAGTGKTIVALHRAAYLARTYPNARILLTTFSDTLANALRIMLRRLLGNEPRLAERIDIYSLNAIGLRLLQGPRRSGNNRDQRDRARANARGRRGGQRSQVRSAFPPHRVGSGGRRLAIARLGSVSRCRTPWPQDTATGSAA